MMSIFNENHLLPRRHEQAIKPGERISLCRCWKSATFPYCDGAHKAHNAETGDCVGPAVITVATSENQY